MSKFKLLFLAAAVFAGAASANAQQKAGYFNMDAMISIMPEAESIQTQLQKFQADSINAEFQSLVQDYNIKDSILKDSLKLSASLKRQYRQDLEEIAYKVQNWQQISQQYLQNKQQALLAPVYQKVYKALTDVSKENGYGFVYREEALMIAPPGDNLLPMVAKKLNVKLPTPDGAQGQGAAQTPARPANNPKPTTPKKGTK